MSNLGKWQELIELADKVGGPDILVEHIFQHGKNSGRKEVLIIGGITIAITGAIGGIIALVQKNMKDNSKIEAMKTELIETLKSKE
ncbi:hypothetical protein N7603_05455 [Acholeplasma vituli]|uniref:Uncharacterized protein n=1 Tax=Paracholeplasma vituli TaxID=69473 RepID=A0ABT2PVW0_9MOLU|nr:hypothetical protein [Paracholeplasma vituli]MCU0105099.1 hypothetical protein [Paracholeplasma vituli]